MRKVIALVLVFAMILPMINVVGKITASAASTAELLINPGFEDDITGWTKYSPSDYEIVTDGTHSGDKAMLMTNRQNPYGVYREVLNDILTVNGKGEYTFGVWAKLPKGVPSCPCQVVIVIKGSNSDNAWSASDNITLTTEWQKIEAKSKTLTWEGDVVDSGIYISTGPNVSPDIYVDDFSLVKESPVNGSPLPTKGNPIVGDETKRGETTTIGAIRWDGWFGEPRTGEYGYVSAEVERTLSPAKFHYRTPFFGEITADDKVSFPDFTQETFDKEILYAADAGIDYWAFCWFDGNDIGKVRKFLATSQYKNKIKICSIFGPDQYSNDSVNEIKSYFKSGLWQTVQGGRPLMYYYTDADITKSIGIYRGVCSELGIPAPYVVRMGGTGVGVDNTLVDAISDYAIFGSGGAAFSTLMDKEVHRWKSTYLDGKQMIPCISTGWDPRPRNNPDLVPPSVWAGDANAWVQTATPAELTTSVTSAYQWIDANKKLSLANTAIMYAWNEHDEGGWICPTIAVDENGNAIKNADGTNKIDTSRLDAVKAAITAYKTVGLPSPTPKPVPGATNSPEPTATMPVNTNDNSSTLNIPLIIAISVGAIVIIGGGIIFIGIKRNKKQSPIE